MPESRLPRPPSGSGPAGKRLWRSVLREYSLTGGDLFLLEHAVVLADEVAGLAALLAISGPVITDRFDQPCANPVAVQHRLATIALGRVLASIRVIGDAAADEPGTRTQHRVGFRPPYTGLRAVDAG
jgi:hypothetical protein